ncbi:MAG: histidine phosphatase family protein [Halobacteriota archaeon]|nr:histidine phosphatase family protein [Halobacteriota archaeon]
MKLILVRHGETHWNYERRVLGISDIELNEVGIKQAECLSRCLRDEEIHSIYSSNLKRAYQTAEIIGQFHEVDIEVKEGLCELNQGDFEGKAFTELIKNHSKFLKRWMEDPTSVIMPNGESLIELQNRAWNSFQEIRREEKNAIVVSHNFTIMALLCKIKEMDLKDIRNHRIDNASKTVIQFEDKKPILVLTNDVSHLCEMK